MSNKLTLLDITENYNVRRFSLNFIVKSAAQDYADTMELAQIHAEASAGTGGSRIPALPDWVSGSRPEDLDSAAIFCGAALSHLSSLIRNAAIPQALWRSRLALMATEQGMANIGRREGTMALRDAVHLTQPCDHPGPAGELLRAWYLVVRRPLTESELVIALPRLPASRISEVLGTRPEGNPVRHAAQVLETILSDTPRAEAEAVMMADAALSQALRFERLMPLLSFSLKRHVLHLKASDLERACYQGLVLAVGKAVPMASDLSRRASRLLSVAPKLRAKGAERAIDMFLSRDALRPTDFAAFMSDRAARRFCDRLVALGVVREITGRDSFRLYGL